MQFTFASNAATIVGGCLVTNRYKLRLPAAFISAFFISVGEPVAFFFLPFLTSYSFLIIRASYIR